MKNIIKLAVLLSVCLLASCVKQDVTPAVQTKDADLFLRLSGETPSRFHSVKLTAEVETACASAIGKMKLMCDVSKAEAVNSMPAAHELIWRNINIAVAPSSRACVEYKGWFLISRLDTAGKDDESFKTGIAVKKGTTEIYKWK